MKFRVTLLDSFGIIDNAIYRVINNPLLLVIEIWRKRMRSKEPARSYIIREYLSIIFQNAIIFVKLLLGGRIGFLSIECAVINQIFGRFEVKVQTIA